MFFFSVGVFSQEKYIKHKISKGENITVIAKKYGVKPKEIIEANPNAPKILKLNSVLLIPNNSKEVVLKPAENIENANTDSHEVQTERNTLGNCKKIQCIS